MLSPNLVSSIMYVMYVPYLLYSSMYCGVLYMYYVYVFIGALGKWNLLPG
jgi:hypothetical protein